MAYTNINKPDEYFNTKLYTGTGATQSITGVNFQPDFVWIKDRSIDGDNHQLYDAVRGTTKSLQSNNTNAEITFATGLTAFDSDGFSLGSEDQHNGSSDPFVSWNWLANGAGSSNTDGSITSTVSANTTSGFSIVQYTGTGIVDSTVGHGLGSKVEFLIIKDLGNVSNWIVGHKDTFTTGEIYLNSTAALSAAFGPFNKTAPTTSVFNLGTDVICNGSGRNYIAYCFAEKKGFSKFGSYTGNGSTDGTFIYTGFKPAFVMVKRSSDIGNWNMFDSVRDPSNIVTKALSANLSSAEDTSASDFIDITSNGFKQRSSTTNRNASGSTYIYMAFAEHPLVSSTGVPCTAR